MQSPYPDAAGAGSTEKAAEQKPVKKARGRYRFFAYLLIKSAGDQEFRVTRPGDAITRVPLSALYYRLNDRLNRL